MTVFVFIGGITVGRNVMTTLSRVIITIDLTLSGGVAVLFFIGLGSLVANLFSFDRGRYASCLSERRRRKQGGDTAPA